MPMKLSNSEERETKPLRKVVRKDGSLSGLAERISEIASNVEAIVHKIWGNGDVGIITHLEVMRTTMVTKDNLDEAMNELHRDIMDAVRVQISLAVLEHKHDDRGDTQPKKTLVQLAADAGVDLPALIQSQKKPEQEKSKLYTALAQINDFLRAWPIIYAIILVVLLALGKPLEEVIALFKAIGQP